MKKIIGLTIVLVACILVLTGITIPEKGDRVAMAGSAVRINIGSAGTCSGVHIGNGFVLTAAHCTTTGDTLTVETDLGGKATARLMWANVLGKGGYDIALLKVEEAPFADNWKASKVACEAPKAGDVVTMFGQPLGLRFTQTWGRVASGELQAFGLWRQVILVDAAGAKGMSGGPVLRADGKVIGLVVGGVGAMAPITFVAPMHGGACDLLAMA